MSRISLSLFFTCLLLSGSCVKGSATRNDSKAQYRSGVCGKAVIADLGVLEQYCDIESSDRRCKAAAKEFLASYPGINCSVEVQSLNEDTNDVEVTIETITPAWVKSLAESLGADDEDEDSVDDVEEEVVTEI